MRGFATKAVIGVIAICSVTATALAATRGQPEAPDRRGPTVRLPAPEIVRHPRTQAISARARFAFTHDNPAARFECRLDRARWMPCATPLVLRSLPAGRHRLAVRAVDRRGRRSGAARFGWTILEARNFTIAPDLSKLGALYPGALPAEIPVTVTNPNPVPISVIGLTVSVRADPPGCTSAENLALAPSSASKSSPLRVPAHGSVSLPATGVSAPSIALRDLPVNQDPCQNAGFPLQFGGSARG